MWVPFCVLSQEMRHMNFILGAQNGGFVLEYGWLMPMAAPMFPLFALNLHMNK